ncbi:unnamed protein product [Soboliphyme baturini]|uniref:protein disulfide-isomerase n=1 Tax=Soboliphyme baturini TaxID=241478 RepID=A0A183IHJ9_9BILA|nr:unnamed protein product [Soboliphyme baturini]
MVGRRAALIEFYAPWCGHCKALAPEYEKAASDLKARGVSVPLAKVDATTHVELAKRFDVTGYPTMKFWNEGQFSDYDGDRTAEGIVDWIRQRKDPNYVPLPDYVLVLTQDNFTAYAMTEDLILVEFYAPWCGHCKRLAPEYKKAASLLNEHHPPIPLAKVDATAEKDLATEYNVTGFPTLKIFRNGRVYDYTGPQDAQAEALREKFPRFFYATSAEVKNHYKIGHGVFLLFPDRYWSKSEPMYLRLEQDNPSTENIVDFINNNCLPKVGERTISNKDTRYTKKPLVVVYYDVDFSFEHKDGITYRFIYSQQIYFWFHCFAEHFGNRGARCLLFPNEMMK